MNELKQRRRGFLAALLAAVLILGTPGVTAMATTYWYGDDPMENFPPLTNGIILNDGDEVYHFYSGSMTCSDDATIVVFDQPNGNVIDYISGDPITVSGGPYRVFTISGGVYVVAYSGTTASDTPISGYYRSLAALVSAIKMEGGETHGYGIGSALPYSVMKALADNPDDVLVFKTDYKGYHYEFTLQVGEDVKDKITPEIPWYGPYWLAKYFYKTTVIEKLPDYS